ncbi:hypothetical protein ACVWZ6_007061 [Bradyrhizobium sp. GM6.1]
MKLKLTTYRMLALTAVGFDGGWYHYGHRYSSWGL